MIRCMSVRQPWASLIVPPVGVSLTRPKDVENRRKTPPPRWMRDAWDAGQETWIAIHASAGAEEAGVWKQAIGRAYPYWMRYSGLPIGPLVARRQWPRGAVIGWIRVVGWLQASDLSRRERYERTERISAGQPRTGDYPYWDTRCHGWKLADPRPLDPIPCKGQQSVLWRPKGELLEALQDSADRLGLNL